MRRRLNSFTGRHPALLSGIREKGLVPAGAKGGDQWARIHRKSGIVDASADKRPRSVYLVDHAALSHVYAEHAAEMHPGSTPIVLRFQLPRLVADRLKTDELDEEARRYEGVLKSDWIIAVMRLTES